MEALSCSGSISVGPVIDVRKSFENIGEDIAQKSELDPGSEMLDAGSGPA